MTGSLDVNVFSVCLFCFFGEEMHFYREGAAGGGKVGEAQSPRNLKCR